jgi:D-sedoheptulose 7-phosphate isomerase
MCDSAFREHLDAVQSLYYQQAALARIAARMASAISGGKKILWCGNGGSAADSQHLAAELVGRFQRERKGLPSIALTCDTSILTAVGNDYGYENIFSRQVEALCVSGDIVVGISTSGNSRNVLNALETANALGAYTVAFTGSDGGAISKIAHATLSVGAANTARIQECHILCGHILCDWIESSICSQAKTKETAIRNDFQPR